MARPPAPVLDCGYEIVHREDRVVKLGVVAAHDRDLVRIARARRSQNVTFQEGFGFAAGFAGYVVGNELDRVQESTVLGDNLVEWLVPAKRVRRNDRRLMPANNRKQLSQPDSRPDFTEGREPIDQEVPFLS